MIRHFYISDDLNDLEHVEEELEKAGLSTPQIHVLSYRDAEVASHHHLHEVESILKQDVVHGSSIGALVGLAAAILVLVIAWFTRWHETVTWIPFVFLSIIMLGFCTWEGGLFGLRKPNVHFRRFRDILKQGKHVFFVDIDESQKAVLECVLKDHPRLKLAGTGPATPGFLVHSKEKWDQFIHWAP